MTESEREEARELYNEWEEQTAEEQEAASRASLAAQELEDRFGIDPENPPEWLK